MPSTWSQVLIHFVFSTHDRVPNITPAIEERLYPFIGGIVRDLGGVLRAVGGTADHIHLLIQWKPDPSIATLAREIKHRSSQWIHEELHLSEFAWQRGYGVFSVSASQSDRVKDYVLGQKGHHEKLDFRSELVTLLKAHGVGYDEKYLD